MLLFTLSTVVYYRFDFLILETEIQIVIAEEMAEKEIQFPLSKSPEDDYIQISGSSLQTAGKLFLGKSWKVRNST